MDDKLVYVFSLCGVFAMIISFFYLALVFSGNYNDLTNLPVIANNSKFTIKSDSNFVYAIDNDNNSIVCYNSDFSVVMQYCINSFSVSGGKIFIRNPYNVYNAKNTIIVYPNITIDGENERSTEIVKNFNNDLFQVMPRNQTYRIGFVCISNLMLQGNRSYFPLGIGINCSLYDSHIRNNYINGFDIGILLNGNSTTQSYYVWVNDNHIEYNNYGIQIINSSNAFIQNNIISEQYKDGIYIASPYAYSEKIIGNTILHNGMNGINANGAGIQSTYSCNIFQTNGWNTTNTYYDLRQYGGGAWVTITANVFYAPADVKYMIDVYTYSSGGINRTVISSNIFTASGKTGYILYEGAGISGVQLGLNAGLP